MVAEMKNRYDFTQSVRNPYLNEPKKQLTIRIDKDTVASAAAPP
jgi:uncharacterized protein (DUF4415 family)